MFESFEQDAAPWEVAGPAGSITGQSIGAGPALYFLGGLEGTSELFRLLAWLLREEFRCVLYDPLPEKNPAAANRDDPQTVPEVQQLFAVADQLEHEPVMLYGTGFGGWVALAAMSADAETKRFRGAVLQGAYARRSFKLLERILLSAAKRSKRTMQQIPGWRAVFAANHRHWFPPFDLNRWILFQQIAGRVPVRTVAQRIAPLRKVRLEHRLAKIAAPVLCLETEGQGKLLQQRQQELQQSLANCRVEWLQDSGLVPHWTHPHRVAKIIREFAGANIEAAS